MKFKFKNKKITGIVSAIPQNRVRFMDEIDNYGFSYEKSIKLKATMGFNERRIVKGNECASDLCLFAIEYLLQKNLLIKENIAALIFVSQTPDHFLPPTSSILHGKLHLDQDTLCMDINQGCTGYLYGLLQAFMILDNLSDNKKVLLLNGDTLSRCSCPQDRNIFPMIGDAGAVTVVENENNQGNIFMDIRTDGSRSDWLIIPSGAFRHPSTEKTREVKTLKDGNKRSDDDFFMNGAGVFTFTQTDVPVAINELFTFSGIGPDEVNYFIFHQPNKFILDKLSHKIGVPENKLPRNIVERFGNSSSATIPINFCYNIGDELKQNNLLICMAGFGVGLSWGTLIMRMGPLAFCELIEK